MSRDCQLKYATLYVRTSLSFKSKRRIELLIYNPFQAMIPQSPQFHTSLRLAVHAKCAVGVQLARSIVNGLVH